MSAANEVLGRGSAAVPPSCCFIPRPSCDRLSEKSWSNENTLPPVVRADIEGALAAIRAFMDAIEQDFLQTKTAYMAFTFHGNDATKLVLALKQALRYNQLVKERTIPLWDLNKFQLPPSPTFES
jgi:hypothetical protein